MILSERNRRTGRFSLNLSLSLSLSLCLFLTACPEDVPVDTRDTTIHLSVDLEGTFSVQLKVSVEDSSDTWTFELTRDDSTVNTVIANEADTIITDGGLNPGATYRYRAYFLHDGARADSSMEAYANTLDTSSHAFIFEIDTLGNYGSHLNDVAIVDEDNIWVVGNIETDSGEYNAARWNGTEWELMGVYSNTLDLYSIWYFTEDDIWALSSYPIHWDGNEWTHYHLTNMGIIPGGLRGEIWGANPNNVYFVGASGRIVHYDGSGFEGMESGTKVDLTSITGTGSDNVWISGFTEAGSKTILLRFNGEEWLQRYYCEGVCGDYTNGITSKIKGIYADSPDSLYVLTQRGLYRWTDEELEPGIWFGSSSDPTATIEEFYGNSTNDLFYGGHYGRIWHYNGASFQFYQTKFEYGIIYGISANDLLFVAVGRDTNTGSAFVIRGVR